MKRSNRKKNKESLSYILLMLPYLVIFFVFTILPVLIAIFLSFTDFNVMELPIWTGFKNYRRLFLSDSLFKKALTNTLMIAVVTGPGGYLLSFGFAWLLNEFNPRLRSILTLLLYAPSISGGAFAVWSIIYSTDRYGWLNSILLKFDIIYEPIAWTTDSKYMFPAAVIMILWMSLGTSFLSYIAGFQTIDASL